MQKVFNLTNRYIILATPLILYTLVSSIYLAISTNNGKLINLIVAILLFGLMTGAFIAGWFNMIKIAIQYPEKEDVNSLIKEFPSGVGEYFLPSLGLLFVIFVFSLILIIGSHYVGLSLIGDPVISAESLANAMQSSATIKSFIAGLNEEQLLKIGCWNLLLLGTMTLIYYLIFLYVPALFFKNKNHFIAFFISLKDLFSRKIFKTTGLFLLIFIINFIITLFSASFESNIIVHFLITLLNFYFITIASVGICYYYYENFIAPKLGQNVDIKI